MNEKEAREIIKNHNDTNATALPAYPFVMGYLDAIEKAKVLEEAFDLIIDLVAPEHGEESERHMRALEFREKWGKEK